MLDFKYLKSLPESFEGQAFGLEIAIFKSIGTMFSNYGEYLVGLAMNLRRYPELAFVLNSVVELLMRAVT